MRNRQIFDDPEEIAAQAPQQGAGGREHVAQKASEVTHKLGEKVDEGREQAAEKIKSAAERLRERASQMAVAAPAGEKLAEGMERAADYLHRREKRGMLGGLMLYVRQHPKRSILGAIVMGFIIARILK